MKIDISAEEFIKIFNWLMCDEVPPRGLSTEQKEIIDEYNKVADLFYEKNNRPKAV
ncbi:MAG: hypothetical protein IJG80_09020 [Selenomonadaceae bacterium]|nr:hypothetical protein [Selenomonadaceae bacterium]